jgi:hypothetical protein
MTEAALMEAGEVVDLIKAGAEDTKLPPYLILFGTQKISL